MAHLGQPHCSGEEAGLTDWKGKAELCSGLGFGLV